MSAMNSRHVGISRSITMGKADDKNAELLKKVFLLLDLLYLSSVDCVGTKPYVLLL